MALHRVDLMSPFRTVRDLFNRRARRSHADAHQPRTEHFPVTLDEDQWRNTLTPGQYRVLRDHGTERPGSSPLNDEHRDGVYRCVGCGQHLFSSATKFDSGTGWPSFWQPLGDAIGTRDDGSWWMATVEVHCSRCGGHLGHVFDDGPPTTGDRYCMNGIALTFTPGAT